MQIIYVVLFGCGSGYEDAGNCSFSFRLVVKGMDCVLPSEGGRAPFYTPFSTTESISCFLVGSTLCNTRSTRHNV